MRTRPPEDRGPSIIALDAHGCSFEMCDRFLALFPPDPLRRMSEEEAEGSRPDWHSWVYGSARNPFL